MSGSGLHIIVSADATLTSYGRLADLPSDARALMDIAARDEFACGPGWFANVEANGLAPSEASSFVVGSIGSAASLVVPMRRDPGGGLSALTTPYTCVWRPILGDTLAPDDAVRLLTAFAGTCRRFGTVRLDAIPAEWHALPLFVKAARSARLVPLVFEHFGNWHERVAGIGFDEYVAARPGELRQTIRRRLRRAEADPACVVEIITGGDTLEAGIAAFEAVYARSWKEPEPFPRFNAGLIRTAAAGGMLRLGVLRQEGRPVAVQLWIVEPNGRATVHKLAHDEAHRAWSPGTVLAAVMIRRLLDEEHVAELDYGRGDDPYKRLWTRERRRRIGFLLANPLHPRGAVAIARQAAARLRRSLRSGA
jgi:hypothetical protein